MTLRTIVSSYWIVAFFVAAAAALMGGATAGLSALAGGVAVAVPGTVFALLLALHARFAPSAGFFLLGEAVKVVATVVLLIAAVKALGEPVWLALLAGLAFTAKAGWLSFVFSMRGNHGSFWARPHSL